MFWFMTNSGYVCAIKRLNGLSKLRCNTILMTYQIQITIAILNVFFLTAKTLNKSQMKRLQKYLK